MPTVKLAITSDLHLPITPLAAIADLGRQVAAFGPDLLAVAGDVAESLAELHRCLDALRQLVSCPIVVVAGNHDLWARERPSVRLWEEVLPQTIEAAGCHWLEGKAIVHEGVAVAGTIGWYDYSAAYPSIRATERVFAENKQFFNQDARFIDWEWSDPEFAARVAQPFLATLDRLEADPAVRQTVVFTHVPLLECQMCRRPDNPQWAFSNAYFGNLTLGEEVLERRKVSHIVSGHTHVGRQGRVTLADGRTVEAEVLASDYGHPQWTSVVLEGN